jgi:hypothetical protein
MLLDLLILMLGAVIGFFTAALLCMSSKHDN